MKETKGISYAPYLVLMAGILWGMIGLFVRKLNEYGLSSMDIVGVRAVVTAAILFVSLFVFDRDLLKIKLRDLWCFLGTGILSIVFFNFCYFSAIDRISLAVAAILLYTAPAFVLIMSAFLFKEVITKKKILCILFVIIGCGLAGGIANESLNISLSGILYGLGAGVGYALYSIFSRFAIDKGYKSLTITFYTFLIATIVTLPFAHIKLIFASCTNDSSGTIYVVLFGIVTTVLPYILYTFGLKDMDNSKASLIASIEPITATVLGIVVFSEKIYISQWIGIALVIGAIAFSNKKTKK